MRQPTQKADLTPLAATEWMSQWPYAANRGFRIQDRSVTARRRRGRASVGRSSSLLQRSSLGHESPIPLLAGRALFPFPSLLLSSPPSVHARSFGGSTCPPHGLSVDQAYIWRALRLRDGNEMVYRKKDKTELVSRTKRRTKKRTKRPQESTLVAAQGNIHAATHCLSRTLKTQTCRISTNTRHDPQQP